MIALVTSNARERAAFASLCESRSWPHLGCDSVRALRRLLGAHELAAIVTRHKLNDGYSDDILALLASTRRTSVRTIVLFGAGAAAGQEARQIALGADCVLRDPVRTDVLLEYLARFRASVGLAKSPTPDSRAFSFAAATLDPADRSLTHAGRSTTLTPREAELATLLFESREQVVSYPTLYHDLLERPFRGDTSNMRVLLGKLVRSFSQVGIALRDHIEVIPKAGYRYRAARPAPQPARRARRKSDPLEPAA